MIKEGDRVRIRAVCHEDAFYHEGRVTPFIGKTGTVVSPYGLTFNKDNATFSGKIKFDEPPLNNINTIYPFYSIQVKKLKE